MRPLKRELSGDAHADAVHNSQIAHLAEAALGPIVDDYASAVTHRLINFVRTRTPTPYEQVWASLGELAACAEIKSRIEAAKRGTK